MTHTQAKNLLKAQVQRLTPKSIQMLKPQKFSIKFMRMILSNSTDALVSREVLYEVFKRALEEDAASKKLIRETLAKNKNEEVRSSLLSGFYRLAEKGDARAIPYLMYSAVNEQSTVNKNLAIGGLVELFIKKKLSKFPDILLREVPVRDNIIWNLRDVADLLRDERGDFVRNEIERIKRKRLSAHAAKL